MDKNGAVVHEWPMGDVAISLNCETDFVAVVHEWPMGDRQLGMDARLLDDGRLLISLKVGNPPYQFWWCCRQTTATW